jgi:hypothetical protein
MHAAVRTASSVLRGGGGGGGGARGGLLDLRDAATAASSRALSSAKEAIANTAAEAPGVSGRDTRSASDCHHVRGTAVEDKPASKERAAAVAAVEAVIESRAAKHAVAAALQPEVRPGR